MTPSGTRVAGYGETVAYRFTQAAGMRVGNVTVDGLAMGPLSGYTFSQVTGNHSLNVVFDEAGRYTVVCQPPASGPAEGVVGPALTFANPGECLTLYLSPARGYQVTDVQLNGVSLGPVLTCRIPSVSRDSIVTASFQPRTFTVRAAATGKGQVSPSGSQSVSYGQPVSFHCTPDPGQTLLDVLLDGRSLGPLSDYTLPGVQADHQLAVRFSNQ
jgi:hypothetical protein